jgi:hypothetical protein
MVDRSGFSHSRRAACLDFESGCLAFGKVGQGSYIQQITELVSSQRRTQPVGYAGRSFVERACAIACITK